MEDLGHFGSNGESLLLVLLAQCAASYVSMLLLLFIAIAVPCLHYRGVLKLQDALGLLRCNLTRPPMGLLLAIVPRICAQDSTWIRMPLSTLVAAAELVTGTCARNMR